MIEGSLQKLIADAAALLTRRNEELREEPQIVADPAPGEAQDFAGIFRYPEARGIILEGNN